MKEREIERDRNEVENCEILLSGNYETDSRTMRHKCCGRLSNKRAIIVQVATQCDTNARQAEMRSEREREREPRVTEAAAAAIQELCRCV